MSSTNPIQRTVSVELYIGQTPNRLIPLLSLPSLCALMDEIDPDKKRPVHFTGVEVGGGRVRWIVSQRLH